MPKRFDRPFADKGTIDDGNKRESSKESICSNDIVGVLKDRNVSIAKTLQRITGGGAAIAAGTRQRVAPLGL